MVIGDLTAQGQRLGYVSTSFAINIGFIMAVRVFDACGLPVSAGFRGAVINVFSENHACIRIATPRKSNVLTI